MFAAPESTRECKLRVTSGTVPGEFRQMWEQTGLRHAMAQVELFPVSVANLTWKERIESRDVILFTDNESVKEALAKGYSRNAASIL
eukprot:6471295-Amphidinium_carterae.1